MPDSILRKYNGKGVFEFKMETPLKEEAKFTLYFFSNARVEVKTSFVLSENTAKILNEALKDVFEVSLNGNIFDENEDIGTISIEKMIITSLNYNSEKVTPSTLKLEFLCFSIVDIIYSDKKSIPVEIRYGLTNFTFLGCEYSGENGKFLLDKFNAEISNLVILFKKVENYKDLESKLKAKNGCYVTLEAIVSLPIAESDKARFIISDMIELLSLATRNVVSPIYEDYFYNGELIRTILKPVLITNYNAANELISASSDPNLCVLKNFLETTYEKYQEFKDVFNLKSVIHLYLISRFAVFTESKFLLAVVSLESLLSYFEEYLKSNEMPIEPGLVKKTEKTLAKELKKEGIELEGQVVKRIAVSIAYSNPTFNEKLIPLLKMFNVKYNSEDLELINLRNKIVHTAKFPEEFNSRIIVPDDELNRLIYFLDRILLSILGYKNKTFLNIFNKYNEEIL